MELKKSLDNIEIIAALLHDIHMSHEVVFNTRARRLTFEKVNRRVRKEGLSFLTKTLPKLGKAFDKALNGEPFDSVQLGFKSKPNSKLPILMGEFFERIFDSECRLLLQPCAQSVKVIRDFCGLFYKLKLPYTTDQEQQVISAFKQTEVDLLTSDAVLAEIAKKLHAPDPINRWDSPTQVSVARGARDLLSRLFLRFDPTNIVPRHGPGAVATRQQLSEKFKWSNVSSRITDLYPFDEYFCSSMGEVCDKFRDFSNLGSASLPARVLLVPKDSRGPRLISCEPVDYQWVQQGLAGAIVKLVEGHVLTKYNVHFTDQNPNRCGAYLGSSTGDYATLDLKEASDRVSSDLVRLLFPQHVYTYLEACRSLSTVLPDGQDLPLRKFAPMGSALCFPIMALTIWSILTAAAPNADARECILVYGDDVIVKTAYAEDAIKQLESFGLKVNRDKSCIKGPFRESCGVDAFKGSNVTPVRIRTAWSSSPSPNAYPAWIAYANQFHDRKYYSLYNLIVERIYAVYGKVPDDSMSSLTCPRLRVVPDRMRPTLKRTNQDLQKVEYRVWDVGSRRHTEVIDGWSMLLRFFTESRHAAPLDTSDNNIDVAVKPRTEGTWFGTLYVVGEEPYDPFQVSSYTSRRSSVLKRRWR